MTVMSRSLERQIDEIADKSLKIAQAPNCNAVLFRSQTGPAAGFCLYYDALTEFEILEVTKILAEVYSCFPEDDQRAHRSSASNRDLNCQSELSSQLVRAIIDLEGSALHKLLLLTSGNRLLSKENFEIVTVLAQTKHEERFELGDMSQGNFYNYLKNTYILPGVSVGTVLPGGGSLSIDPSEKNSVDHTARLMAFLASNSESRTFSEHLKLNLSEAFATQKSINDFSRLDTVTAILSSEYRELAESMTAKELNSLSVILNNAEHEGQFPKEILRSRSAAMEQDVRPLPGFGVDSILRYLSKDEQESLSSFTFVENLNGLLNGRDARVRSAPIVYAALAEVCSVKGEGKTLEVAKALEHLRVSKIRKLEMYEATVAIIAEALIPANDDLPFGWSAQLSEHAWVLTSHLSKKFSDELVIEFL